MINSKYLFHFLLIIFVVTSCKNPLTQLSNSSTDEAYYEEAIKAAHAGQWVTSIENFQRLSAGFLNQRHVRFDYAKALAGRCGYDFAGFINAINNTNFGGTSSLFKGIMAIWGNRIISPQFCTDSEQQVKIIWSQLNSINDRTTEEKFFMAFLSLAKMGIYLRSKADVDANGGLGDGVVDNGFSACLVASPATQLLRLSDSEIKELVTGLSLFMLNLTAIGAALSNASSITNVLSQVCGPPINATFCNKVNADEVLAAEVATFRKVLATKDIGLGLPSDTCEVSTILTLCCP
jgi:hypothetical protein